MPKKRLGELLLEEKAITPEQLEIGLAFHRSTGQRLGTALVRKGFLTEAELCATLGRALGIPAVDLQKTEPEWEAVHTLKGPMCEAHDVLPLALEEHRGRRHLVVAMSDPLNYPAIEEIEFTTGCKVVPRMAPLSAVRAGVLKYYHRGDPLLSSDSRMTLINAGGETTLVDTEEAEDVVQGEEVTGRTALADLIAEREKQLRARRSAAAQSPVGSASRDLTALFSGRGSDDTLESLERKFWALMRIMARKGLITAAEFSQELDRD